MVFLVTPLAAGTQGFLVEWSAVCVVQPECGHCADILGLCCSVQFFLVTPTWRRYVSVWHKGLSFRSQATGKLSARRETTSRPTCLADLTLIWSITTCHQPFSALHSFSCSSMQAFGTTRGLGVAFFFHHFTAAPVSSSCKRFNCTSLSFQRGALPSHYQQTAPPT